MAVRVTFRGGLGNNLFQYALGRIVAQHHGLAMTCTSGRARSRSFNQLPQAMGDIGLEDLVEYFPNAPLELPGETVDNPVEAFELGEDRAWQGQTLSLTAVLENTQRRQIRLDGYFQRYEYY